MRLEFTLLWMNKFANMFTKYLEIKEDFERNKIYTVKKQLKYSIDNSQEECNNTNNELKAYMICLLWNE